MAYDGQSYCIYNMVITIAIQYIIRNQYNLMSEEILLREIENSEEYKKWYNYANRILHSLSLNTIFAVDHHKNTIKVAVVSSNSTIASQTGEELAEFAAQVIIPLSIEDDDIILPNIGRPHNYNQLQQKVAGIFCFFESIALINEKVISVPGETKIYADRLIQEFREEINANPY